MTFFVLERMTLNQFPQMFVSALGAFVSRFVLECDNEIETERMQRLIIDDNNFLILLKPYYITNYISIL